MFLCWIVGNTHRPPIEQPDCVGLFFPLGALGAVEGQTNLRYEVRVGASAFSPLLDNGALLRSSSDKLGLLSLALRAACTKNKSDEDDEEDQDGDDCHEDPNQRGHLERDHPLLLLGLTVRHPLFSDLRCHAHRPESNLCFVTDPFLVPCKHVHLELRPGRKVLNLKLRVMETLDGVLYVEGGEGGRGEDLKHKLLGHPPVIARLTGYKDSCNSPIVNAAICDCVWLSCRKNGEDTWLTLPAKGVETETEKGTVIKFSHWNVGSDRHVGISEDV